MMIVVDLAAKLLYTFSVENLSLQSTLGFFAIAKATHECFSRLLLNMEFFISVSDPRDTLSANNSANSSIFKENH